MNDKYDLLGMNVINFGFLMQIEKKTININTLTTECHKSSSNLKKEQYLSLHVNKQGINNFNNSNLQNKIG